MRTDYYSDRVGGPKARHGLELTPDLWGGIIALLRQGCARNWFARDFPELCHDGEGPCGCDADTLELDLAASIPELELPLRPGVLPSTPAALDLLEYMASHFAVPIEGSYHSHFGHHHLDFGPDDGSLDQLINTLLARNGMAYELTSEGVIRHLSSGPLEEQLGRELPETADQAFDRLLEKAVSQFRSREADVRRDALEPLWDAFERMKTIHAAKKKRGARELLEATGADQHEKQLLEEELLELTEIGNSFRIRHHETDRSEVGPELAEYLFGRMYAVILRLHPALPS